MGYTIHHQFDGDGGVISGERLDYDAVGIRVQGTSENMHVDVVMSNQAALCLAHVILSVLTRPGEGDDEGGLE